ncbi:hypothetical protein KOW79_007107 [Hemibagrus wyckioides]|uniref:Uncharacterized protein n=1 Tax=Hemibagrus wyckioides TaxID=337641 RepID=A0A9D3NX66_9TELE|nr:hypothetical protein KOW79_007107 [Hemibagrus wyckioides]
MTMQISVLKPEKRPNSPVLTEGMDVRLRDGKNENIRAAFPNHDLLDNSCSLASEHGSCWLRRICVAE